MVRAAARRACLPAGQRRYPLAVHSDDSDVEEGGGQRAGGLLAEGENALRVWRLDYDVLDYQQQLQEQEPYAL